MRFSRALSIPLSIYIVTYTEHLLYTDVLFSSEHLFALARINCTITLASLTTPRANVFIPLN